MAKRTQKRLLRMEIAITLQLTIFILTVIAAIGYAYSSLNDLNHLFEETHEQTQATLQKVEHTIDIQIPLHFKLLEIQFSTNEFQHQFELLTLDPDYSADGIHQLTEALIEHYSHLNTRIESIPIAFRDPIIEGVGILIDIASELEITSDTNARQHLFDDTVEVIENIRQTINQTVLGTTQTTTVLHTELLDNMTKSATSQSNFKNQLINLNAVIIGTIFLIVFVPSVIQLLFFRNLRNRLQQLEVYAGDIANENFKLPPFRAKDKTGHLAIRLALMGRRIRHLLNISRAQRARADTARSEVEKLAYFDPLTGLENRRQFNLSLRKAIKLSIQPSRKIYLLFLDLDNFKEINDSLGHEVGDELLKGIGQRLKASLRSGDHLGRLGGDEFAIIAFHQFDGGQPLLDRLHHAITQPMMIHENEVQITVSIGITLVDSQSRSAEDLLRRADLAMYHAKSQGRNTSQHFTKAMQEKVDEHLSLTQELRHAIKYQQFLLNYQPQIDLRTGETKGMEALIRWQHPEKGMIRPDFFIPVAEETGLIKEIGSWVLYTACQDAMHYMIHHGFASIAINVSANQFFGKNLVNDVIKVLKLTQLPPQYLEIELTEGILLHDLDHARSTIEQLKEIGVSIALDDFGTGYSSLSYLTKFPVDVLKIDRSFINNMLDNPKEQAIVKTIIEMGRHLNMEVLAEGIETEEQAAFLYAHGCHTGQGYLYSRPVPLETLLHTEKPPCHIEGQACRV